MSLHVTQIMKSVMEREGWLNTKQAAIELNLEESTLRNYRQQKVMRGPEFVKIGREVWYTPEAIAQYIKDQTVTPQRRYII